MPADDDEQLTAAPRPIPVAARPAAPTAAPGPGPEGVRFGAAGVFQTYSDLVTFPGERGVVRYVTDGVTYAPPPAGMGWKPVPNESGKYELAWGAPPPMRTLIDLRDELKAAGKHEREQAGHPLRRQLDAVGLHLVELAAQLHADGWTLGLIRRDNIVLKGDEPVLADLGFRWQGSTGDAPWDASPGRPPWLADDAPDSWLWDRPAITRQIADGTVPGVAPVTPLEDVRTLGRLLAWLVGGSPDKVPMVVESSPAVWRLLRDAALGKVATADELAAGLRRAPLSSFYDPPLELERVRQATAATDSGPRTNFGRYVALALVPLIVGAAAVGYLVTRGPDAAPTTGSDEPLTTDPPKPAELVKQFAEAIDTKQLPEAAKALTALHEAAPMARPAERAKLLDLWQAEYDAALTLADDPAERLVAGGRFRALADELAPLVTKFPDPDPKLHLKETECLTLAQARAAELDPK